MCFEMMTHKIVDMLLAHRLCHLFPTFARVFLTRRAYSSLLTDNLLSPSATKSTRGHGGGGSDTLGRRLLSLIYPKRSAVVVLRKWAEEGKRVQKYQLNRVVRELRKYKRFKHALEICEWMTTQPDIKLLPGDYAVHLDLVAKVRGLASAEKFFEDLPERMKGQSTCTALLHTYVQSELSNKAESLMEEMSIHGLLRCPLPYNHMLTLYISKGELDKVPKLVKELKRNTKPDVVTYNLWLSACAKKDDVMGAEEVLREMEKEKITTDWITYSMLATIYIKAVCSEKAKEALVEMEKRASRKERAAYCSLISLHASLSDKENVYRIWNKIKSTFRKMSDVEYKCILSSLTKLGDIEEAESIYSEWESVSGTRDSRVPNILLGYYIKNDMMDKAENFHEHTVQTGVKPSYTTWELLAWSYLSKKRIDKVLHCLKNAFSILEKWEPNVGIIRAVFSKLEMMGDVEGAEQFLVMLRDVGYVTTEIYNSLLRTYAKAGKMPLIVAERMKKDGVQMDEETRGLLRLTSKFCIGGVSTLIS
ncbi:pentatricopeptide repeat-containing protein At4g02820, mitochondrial [Phoenix dactylifera]|uniref:Pentatricopeptide repeat-containing protein At4g02820, mitochondrial n=1 Tax=Phoenix dactylifera TaxID=42345 RepID=A0A8B7C3K4_PHODC|nr:pentatricopeptide repeat-containing protein At4g02820, mitochondrial [Phoenix dactylifera]XP_038980582.1 pentatricopeptide repeat-containing protein At4g02820, mitochondrial [Phoenix dactylifera]